jgi:RND superfamily putative drug exporter
MFEKLGKSVSRWRVIIFLGWFVLAGGIWAVAPTWDSVIEDGEFAFLPEDVPSRRGEELFKRVFAKNRNAEKQDGGDKDLIGSSIVVVVCRETRKAGLTTNDDMQEDGRKPTDSDYHFIDQILKPEIEKIAHEEGGLAHASRNEEPEDDREPSRRSIIAAVRTFSDQSIGPLLKSKDSQASLVFVELTTEFFEKRNRETITKIEDLISRDGDLRKGDLGKADLIPPGLDVAISGLAVAGRDMKLAAEESANATETATVVLVVFLLLIIYRAPVLALIPLLTVGVAVHVAKAMLAILGEREILDLFAGIEIYVTVILYGTGVDYCLFLIARYKEELDDGATYEDALTGAVRHVGPALAASAGTTMAGIGMMGMANFGKFQQAGFAIALSLVIVLLASLTFTPALIRLTGRWAFWPRIPSERLAVAPGWISPTNLVSRLMQGNWLRDMWDRVGVMLRARPGTIWLTSLAIMSPFAVVGVMFYDHLSYGLLSELPDEVASVRGAEAVKKHFPAGSTGPVTILIENPDVDFGTQEGRDEIETLTTALKQRRRKLSIADIRSVSEPLGFSVANADSKKPKSGGWSGRQVIRKGVELLKARQYYVSQAGESADHVTRIDVVFQDDPFSRNSIEQLDRFEAEIEQRMPEELADSKVYFIGATPSIRDLKRVTDGDQVRVDIWVVVAVFAILVLLLKRPAISAYLIISVCFSYLVTLGFTFTVFWAMDPAGFSGLDWKVPMFLFTILIAVGEDYNIYLITRIDEETKRHGAIDGITVALSRTGSIISSCGFIMAGTFSSLLAGSLAGMHQLGFALAFGVLLDTFVVRPILVPAYLILLHSGRFGVLGRLLGESEFSAPQVTTTTPVEVGSDP